MSTNPRAQVPGYCGFIPGKNAENKFGASFGHITKGAYTANKDAFLTTNISNNEFIKKQHPQTDTFWSNNNKINVFQKTQQQTNQSNKTRNWAVHDNYKPQAETGLSYEEALKKAHRI